MTDESTTRPVSRPVKQSAIQQLVEVLRRWNIQAQQWLLCDQHALYGAAFARIASGLSVIGILLTNFRWRDLIFGPGASWAQVLPNREYWPALLIAHLGETSFLVVYLLTIAMAVGWTLGWHAKIVGLFMLIGHVAMMQRTPFVGDQGDNALRLGLYLLLLMNVTEVWALDARRRSNASTNGRFLTKLWRSQPVLPRWIANAIHNVAVALLAFQLTLIYISAGMYKTQGAYWQNGTALYYPLSLPEFRPIPELTNLLLHADIMVGVVTYVVVFTQLFFPVMLIVSVATRRIAIALVMLFHLSIAIVMALPWFSLELLALDSIFISTMTYQYLERWIRQRGQDLRVLFKRRPSATA